MERRVCQIWEINEAGILKLSLIVLLYLIKLVSIEYGINLINILSTLYIVN